MPSKTAATSGAAALIRSLISSRPFWTYRSRQGEPRRWKVKQSSAMLEKPMSLPPMLIVTSSVSGWRLSNCGGLGPGVTPWGWVMSSVSAPLQLGSRNSA